MLLFDAGYTESTSVWCLWCLVVWRGDDLLYFFCIM